MEELKAFGEVKRVENIISIDGQMICAQRPEGHWQSVNMGHFNVNYRSPLELIMSTPVTHSNLIHSFNQDELDLVTLMIDRRPVTCVMPHSKSMRFHKGRIYREGSTRDVEFLKIKHGYIYNKERIFPDLAGELRSYFESLK